MRKILLAVICMAFAAGLSGCVSRQTSPESAYVVNSQGAVSPIARSALAGSTAPGKQEILGIYVPFVGTGLAIKAGLEWDGTPTLIEVPIASQPVAQAAPQYVETQETYYEPETRMVPKTRTVRRAVVPVPTAVPAAGPCAKPGAAPPPEPVAKAHPLPTGNGEFSIDSGDRCPSGSCEVATAK